MIIRIIAASRSVDIDDVHNFKAFTVRVEGPFDNRVAQDEVLGRVAIRHDSEHAWIAEDWLREWPPLQSEFWWQEGLTNMIAAVQRFGWVDPANRAIRGHIEYAS